MFQYRHSGIDRPPWEPPYLSRIAGREPSSHQVGWESVSMDREYMRKLWLHVFHCQIDEAVAELEHRFARHQCRIVADILFTSRTRRKLVALSSWLGGRA